MVQGSPLVLQLQMALLCQLLVKVGSLVEQLLAGETEVLEEFYYNISLLTEEIAQSSKLILKNMFSGVDPGIILNGRFRCFEFNQYFPGTQATLRNTVRVAVNPLSMKFTVINKN